MPQLREEREITEEARGREGEEQAGWMRRSGQRSRARLCRTVSRGEAAERPSQGLGPILLRASRRNQPYRHLDFRLLVSTAVRE